MAASPASRFCLSPTGFYPPEVASPPLFQPPVTTLQTPPPPLPPCPLKHIRGQGLSEGLQRTWWAGVSSHGPQKTPPPPSRGVHTGRPVNTLRARHPPRRLQVEPPPPPPASNSHCESTQHTTPLWRQQWRSPDASQVRRAPPSPCFTEQWGMPCTQCEVLDSSALRISTFTNKALEDNSQPTFLHCICAFALCLGAKGSSRNPHPLDR